MKITFTNICHSSYVNNIQTSNMSICMCNQNGKRTPEPEDAALYGVLTEAKKPLSLRDTIAISGCMAYVAESFSVDHF